ncbi:MAG: substrate-binding domain-containing protein [Oscillospiraceae bacterium]|nr:substrate-binding domain-containing protein [Oscillospiraceae bacterium]
MKQKIFLFLALALLLFIAGCTQQNLSVEDSISADENLIKIGVSQIGAESDWRVANSESIKTVFTEARGYHLLFDDARQKQENQITAIRKFIQQQVDYIVLMPIQETGWDSVLLEAKQAHIPVILVDRMIAVEDESLYASHVGSDFLWEGEQAVEWMRLKEKELNIVQIQGTQDSTAQLGRTQALEKAVEEENWNLLVQLDGDFTQAKTYEVMGDYLSQAERPEIDIVYCENDNEAFGAIQALEEYGYTCGKDGVDVISFDATRQGLKLCLEGKISLIVECQPLLGPLVEEVIQCLEAGCVPEQHYYADEEVFMPNRLTRGIISRREY